MRWPWVRKTWAERVVTDLEVELADVRADRDGALRLIDAGLMPIKLEHVPDPPMWTIIQTPYGSKHGWQATCPVPNAAWAGLERPIMDMLIGTINGLRLENHHLAELSRRQDT